MEILGVLVVLLLVIGIPVAALVMALAARGQVAAMDARLGDFAREQSRLGDELARLRAELSGNAAARGDSQGADESGAPQPEEGARQPAPDAPPIPPEMPEGIPAAARADAGGYRHIVPPPLPAGAGPGRPDLETRIGARWTVMLGGVATALGAVLLVRAAIEAGLLGPGARIALGTLFSAALLAGGEALRRRDRKLALPIVPQADIPAVLTGAGAVGAFATAYSAYALYGFIGPAAAFVILTAVGLATLALSAVHGPKMAALGVVGSFATPLLVSSDAPNLHALAVHVLVVTGSVLGVAVLRQWLWLAMAGVAGMTGWTALAAFSPDPGAGLAGFVMSTGAAMLFAAAFGYGAFGPPSPPADRPADRPGIIAFAALALAFFVQAAANGQLPLPVAGLAVALVVAASAILWTALAPAAIAAALVALTALAATDLALAFDGGLNSLDDIRQGLVPPDIAGFVLNALLVCLPVAGGLLYGSWRSAAPAPGAAGWLAWGAVAVAVFGLVIAYMRISPFETDRLFGAAALAVAFGFALLSEAFSRLRPGDLQAQAPAALAVGSVAALSFCLAVSLDAGWMPLGFAVAAAGIAWIHRWRPLAVLPWLSVAAGIVAAGTIWASQPFFPGEIGTTPFLNRLVLLAGLPAAALVWAGESMRRRGVGVAAAIAAALGLALAGLFVALEIRHWLNGGDILARRAGLAELSAQALAALGFAIGLQRVATLTGARLYANATLVAGAVSALVIGGGLLLIHNPLFTDAALGPRLFLNELLPAYLLTAAAAAGVALQARPVRPRAYVLAFAALSGLLLFAWVTLTIRQYFQGGQLGFWRATSEAEVWTYSAAWLALGVAVLAVGHLLHSAAIRLASGLLIALTVCKVFLFDLPALTGAMRAFSVIGLGLSLLAIGWFYQRILRPAPQASGGPGPGPS